MSESDSEAPPPMRLLLIRAPRASILKLGTQPERKATGANNCECPKDTLVEEVPRGQMSSAASTTPDLTHEADLKCSDCGVVIAKHGTYTPFCHQ